MWPESSKYPEHVFQNHHASKPTWAKIQLQPVPKVRRCQPVSPCLPASMQTNIALSACGSKPIFPLLRNRMPRTRKKVFAESLSQATLPATKLRCNQHGSKRKWGLVSPCFPASMQTKMALTPKRVFAEVVKQSD